MRSQIIPTPAEIEQKRLDRGTVAQACAQFHKEGALVLRGAYAEPHLIVARQAIGRRVSAGLDERRLRRLGKHRVMTSLPIEYPYNAPHIYANPLVLRILKRLLGDAFVLSHFGAMITDPGAESQQAYREHSHLFQQDEMQGDLPVYAVTVLVPLVPMTRHSGTTRLWEGSHRMSETQALSNRASHLTSSVGDSLLMDYRVWRGGTQVRQEKEMPALYLVYSRPWFRDYVNLPANYQVEISRDDLEQVPVERQHLFALAATQRTKVSC